MNEEHFDLKLLISDQAIQQRIKETAVQLEKDYKEKPLIIVMVMKGAIILVADLIRHLSIPFELEYVHASSYGHRGTTPGEVVLRELRNLEIKDKHVLIIDDIFDTGNTLSKVSEALQAKDPASLKSLVLLEKKMERKIKMQPEYVLFKIENLFVVGYGLDFKEYLRGLRDIYVLNQ